MRVEPFASDGVLSKDVSKAIYLVSQPRLVEFCLWLKGIYNRLKALLISQGLVPSILHYRNQNKHSGGCHESNQRCRRRNRAVTFQSTKL